MKKVITYGTYDLLHHGHIRLLERAKKLGDYLIVGVTSDTFDKSRGKINVQQSLNERIEAVRATGIADEIVVEEYEGQKIDDIKRYDIDIFTVGSDWLGKFDYIKEFCKVVYLDRTEGVSSSDIRTEKRKLNIGIVGNSVNLMHKFIKECSFVNGTEIKGICTPLRKNLTDELNELSIITSDYQLLLSQVDAVYIVTHATEHYEQIKLALEQGKHVLCESPIAIKYSECKELFKIAEANNCILMDAIKTAYSLAFERLRLLTKSSSIGNVISIDATCTSLIEVKDIIENGVKQWGSMYSWSPCALMAVFSILGNKYKEVSFVSKYLKEDFDLFTRIELIYDNAVANIKVANGVKSEGELIISGTKGYIYVPAPWWKTDYFEIRYENQAENKRCFYQLEGEGIRYMIVNFVKSINMGKNNSYISRDISYSISKVMEKFNNGINLKKI